MRNCLSNPRLGGLESVFHKARLLSGPNTPVRGFVRLHLLLQVGPYVSDSGDFLIGYLLDGFHFWFSLERRRTPEGGRG